MTKSLPKTARAPITVSAVGAPKSNESSSKFSPKSTNSEAQRQRIAEALRRRPQTTHDLRCLGVFQVATRIKEMRDRFGFNILTERVALYDRDGYLHRGAARYVLIAEPEVTA